MSESENLEIFDFLIIINKWKKVLLAIILACFLISYGVIFFFVQEEYDATALIIPLEQDNLGGFSSLLKTFSSLPVGLSNFQKTSNSDLFNTIIYSRSNLEKIIKEFNLQKDYQLESIEKTIKVLNKKIIAQETRNNAFEISVRANSPQKSAAITNFIVSELNKTIIDLNIQKSKDNKEFLEKRYSEIKNNLILAEDSLKKFQTKTGMLAAEDQIKASIEIYAQLEAELAAKQIELSVLEKTLGKDSPTFNNSKTSVQEFEKKISSLKNSKEHNQLLLSMKNLPKESLEYLRIFREIKINNALLEFIIPLYEQAKFEEQKDIPILQIIDYAVPPEKRAYPQRLLLSGIITLFIVVVFLIFIIVGERVNSSKNPKLKYLLKELLKF